MVGFLKKDVATACACGELLGDRASLLALSGEGSQRDPWPLAARHTGAVCPNAKYAGGHQSTACKRKGPVPSSSRENTELVGHQRHRTSTASATRGSHGVLKLRLRREPKEHVWTCRSLHQNRALTRRSNRPKTYLFG